MAASLAIPPSCREGAAKENPGVKSTRVPSKRDPSNAREFADDLSDGKFVLAIGRRMPSCETAEIGVE